MMNEEIKNRDTKVSGFHLLWFKAATTGIALFAVTLAAGIWWHLDATARHIEKTRKLWVEYQNNAASLAFNVNSISQSLGYGGFIHNFKNLVLRRDPRYIPLIENNISGAEDAFNSVERMELTAEEKNALIILRGTFREYVQKFKIARGMLAEGRSSGEIDSIVRVDDAPALKARKILAGSALTRSRQMEEKTSQSLNEAIKFMELGRITIPFVLLFCVILFFFLNKLVSAHGQIIAAKERAEEATRLKDRFVSIVSHDLRSPFSVIIGFLRLLRNNPNDPLSPQQEILLDKAFHASETLIEMIDELLDISRLQSGKISIDPIPINIHRFIEGVIEEVESLAQNKAVIIVNRLEPDAQILADRRLLDEVFRNLLSNAIKFSHPGGRIDVFRPPGGKPGDVTVMDNGVGMDPAVIPDLFRREVKTSTIGTAGERGTGLGLPFCNELIVAHGGSLSVESKPGKGSSFTVHIPR